MVSVLDQFDIAYREEFEGTYVDDFITGSLCSSQLQYSGWKLVLTTGSRGRVFSKLDARDEPQLSESGQDAITNKSKSFRLQPWFEKVGTPRFISHNDPSERIYDTMLPSIRDIFFIDGMSIGGLTASALFPSNVVTGSGGFGVVSRHEYGFVIFDYGGTVTQTSTAKYSEFENNIVNNNWTKAFPYEPHYADANRTGAPYSGLQLTTAFSISDGEIIARAVVPGPPTRYGFYLGPATGRNSFTWLADVDLVSSLTTSANVSDSIKALYGFGDSSTVYISGSTLYGTNHFAVMRNTHTITSGGITSSFGYNALIRGWKYGAVSGFPDYTKAYFRRQNYGQFRDMLEQRQFTKYYTTITNEFAGSTRRETTSPGVVNVKFVDSKDRITNPENTQSQNLSFEATSSLPYFDGEARNRTTFNINIANTGIVSLGTNLSL